MLIATGGSPRVPPIPGVNLNGVYTLRNISDAEAIRDKSKEAKKIVIVGASFIGMETAAAIKK